MDGLVRTKERKAAPFENASPIPKGIFYNSYVLNGSLGIMLVKKMTEIISEMKNMTILDQTITFKSSVKEDQLADIGALANAIAESITI
ncbi:MAG: hypothetical protein ACK5H4_11180 [Lacrimispora sphenoides]